MSWLADIIRAALDRLAGPLADPVLPPVVDRRHAARPSYLARGKRVYYSPRERPWDDVTAIMLHQTACELGERPARWDTVGAHWGVTRAGQRIHLHDSNTVVAHGNGGNARCIGIEIDGRHCGVEGDLSTLWDDPDTPWREQPSGLPEVQAAAARQLCRDLVAEVAEHGGRVRFVMAHRQSSGSRRNDPGGAIWRRVAMPIEEELELERVAVGWTFPNAGRAIPEAWDPRCRGVPY